MIRLYEIKIAVDENQNVLKDTVIKKIGKYSDLIDIDSIRISSKSIDARKKNNIFYVYNIDLNLKNHGSSSAIEEEFINDVQKINKKIKLSKVDSKQYTPKFEDVHSQKTDKGEMDLQSAARPIIIGFGPAGMFAGLIFALNGLNPIIIERGKPVDERVDDVSAFWKDGVYKPNSNPLFGEGGAGTFSDGKLTTGKKDVRIPFILKEFHEAGAPDEILYMKKPHIGTDVLRKVVKNIRNKIISLGGEIRFNTLCTDIIVKDNKIDSVKLLHLSDLADRDERKSDFKEESISTNALVLAVGHSARETYEMLSENKIYMEQKPFSIGLRIQHKQSLIDQSQYGDNNPNLPPAEYKLSYKTDEGRGVYTFCMCPGGHVITTSAEKNTLSVNGMSNYKRDGEYANSALLVDVRTDDYNSEEPLSGIEFQREYEKRAFIAGGETYFPPTEKLSDFVSEKSKIAKCLPDFASKAIREALPVFGKKIRGFDDENAVLKGIESGSSSPVKIPRDMNYMSNVKGVYPCGEGAGYAGGITSSAVDGIKCAEAVMDLFSRNHG